MGAQNALNGLVGTAGVAVGSAARNMGAGKGLDQKISSAMDGEKNQKAKKIATQNKDVLKKNQEEFKKKVEGVISGANKNLKDRVDVLQMMREV